MDKIMRINEVAKALGISPNKAYQMAADGEIPAFKVAGKWRVREVALNEWLLEQEAAARKGGPDFAEGMMP